MAEYTLGGISFFIPYDNEDDFLKDITPAQDEEELENGSEEAARFEHWMRNGEESLLRELERY